MRDRSYIHGLVLAGGEGSRLAADGVATPKALVSVGGRPQLARLVAQFAGLGCASITCLVHADVAPFVDEVALRAAGGENTPVRVVPCRTPSSLHTLVAGLASVPSGPVFCSMVDTVMAPADWRAVYAAAGSALAEGADALLALTPDPEDDDAPLRAGVGGGKRVTRVGGEAGDYPERPVLITGGVYAFAPAARARAESLAAAGGQRMRAFLAALVDGGADVRAAVVPRILDVDHRRDLDAANAYAAGWQGR